MGVPVADDGDGLDGAVGGKQIAQLRFGRSGIEIANEDGSQSLSRQAAGLAAMKTKRRNPEKSPLLKFAGLECLHVFGLPTLGALGDVELHRLAFLQALETARLDSGEMHENVFAILAADKAVAFGVIEPLYCSLFHKCVCTLFLCDSYAGGIREETCAGYWLLRRELLKTDSV